MASARSCYASPKSDTWILTSTFFSWFLRSISVRGGCTSISVTAKSARFLTT